MGADRKLAAQQAVVNSEANSTKMPVLPKALGLNLLYASADK